ncbi:tetratricopeptide repeat protein [Butyricimonas virosa]|uniref:Sel1 repeat family protein n=1 Tax=Butyricimonas virosa TaxID=544645 RepID=A0A415QFT3_9BACT|nr:tetratricopeptide repeat protein [Butyricimonas virosa]RHM41772.1 sel1 repeat family protein [Butyricimonas virosa]
MEKISVDSAHIFDLIERADTDKEAAYELGAKFLHGIGVPHDELRAFYYLRQAMDLGSMKAVELFGLIYKYGEWDLRRNTEMAITEFEFLLNSMPQDETIIYEILNLYFHGDSGKPFDADKGISTLEWVAQDDEPFSAFANYLLALIYHEGRYGIKKDLKKAEEYCAIALEKGYSEWKIEKLLERIDKDAASENKESA